MPRVDRGLGMQLCTERQGSREAKPFGCAGHRLGLLLTCLSGVADCDPGTGR